MKICKGSMGKCFFVWDSNHWLQAQMPYISRVHSYDLSWHIVAESIMLDTREDLVHLFTTMIGVIN
jgi:hypothetical protein